MVILLEVLYLGKIFLLNVGCMSERRFFIKFLSNLFFVCFVCLCVFVYNEYGEVFFILC